MSSPKDARPAFRLKMAAAGAANQLFRSNQVQPKRSGPFEKHYWINRLEGCCIDRLSWHRLSGVGQAMMLESAGKSTPPCRTRSVGIQTHRHVLVYAIKQS